VSEWILDLKNNCRLTYLAKSSDWRYIAQCEHGTIHLGWDLKTLRLRPEDFLQVGRFLEKANLGYEGEVNDGYNYLRQNKNGYLELWLHGMGLILSAVDFLMISDIVREGVQQLQNPSRLAPKQPQKNEFVRYQLKPISNSGFSLN
jgi:hypothetical protein